MSPLKHRLAPRVTMIEGQPSHSEPETPASTGRYFIAAAVLLAGCGYPTCVLLGLVPGPNRLGPADLALVVFAISGAVVAASPRLLASVRKVKLSGFELELEQVREQQKAQRARIAEIDMLLPLLLPDAQFKHLENLLTHRTASYQGGRGVRDELRQLANSDLIRRLPGRTLGEIEKVREFDLAKYVKLTPLGEYWGQRYMSRKRSAEGEDEADAQD